MGGLGGICLELFLRGPRPGNLCRDAHSRTIGSYLIAAPATRDLGHEVQHIGGASQVGQEAVGVEMGRARPKARGEDTNSEVHFPYRRRLEEGGGMHRRSGRRVLESSDKICQEGVQVPTPSSQQPPSCSYPSHWARCSTGSDQGPPVQTTPGYQCRDRCLGVTLLVTCGGPCPCPCRLCCPCCRGCRCHCRCLGGRPACSWIGNGDLLGHLGFRGTRSRT